jgi:hypothetical protein
MSSAMTQGPPPGMPPPGGDALTKNRSMLNPVDAGMAIDSGAIGPNMTVGQWFEQMGIKWETPVPEALEKIKMQASNSTGLGKARNMAPPGAPPGMPPGGAPPGMGGPPPAGLDGMMG